MRSPGCSGERNPRQKSGTHHVLRVLREESHSVLLPAFGHLCELHLVWLNVELVFAKAATCAW